MLKQMLEGRVGHLSNDEFKEVMDIVTDDIKFNRINFGKRTNKIELIEIAERSLYTLRRCIDLDGTELYGIDGQTIVDIREMVTEHVKNFLEGEEWNLKI
ncbi:Uncharacterised protein [Clostridium tetani]|uniref:hypothetical protein n=3 Tax=Clostridium tetani TaxID=1513 RepID=UPI000E14B2EB|nr:hypothetical protein [Clostridium tetani]WFN62888.1 hypothetical protein PAA20_05425 [Clostridium tetani]BDR83492.1 hypothetical protein K254310026_09030 [Clostridium tetani]SUY55095.1 Uncharacterised protein [Clostridium tetani]